ncbi:F-box domain-containing protein [Mycena chlorophos]|uniref:F-box domain-containing protein n=1 Tax=Mycena chlorophos TaxID=658473 RepID=A0A8H6TPN0_MYCCL|nr:F-box domain-containing protein [Mycena chlorophos]
MLPATTLRAQLVAVDSERAATHAKITELRVHLEKLADTRAALVAQLQKITYPILSLPVEITTLIFDYYARGIAKHCYKSFQSSPLVLTHVCRAWRQIALASPQLWTRIFMQSCTTPDVDAMFRRCFERAGNLPLDVDLSLATDPQVYDILAANSDQCRSMAISFPTIDNLSVEGIGAHLSKLHSLRLHIRGQSDPITAFANAPALRRLEIFWTFSSFSDFDLPWGQLTHLVLHGESSPATTIGILRLVPQLEVLELPAVRYPTDQLSLEFPRLHTLRLSNAETVTLWILDWMRCAQLQNLELLVTIIGWNDVQGLRRFLADNCKELRSLTLSAVPRYGLILCEVPSLTTLHLRRPSNLHRFLQDMAAASDEPLLPRLSDLSIELPNVDVWHDAVAQLLESRKTMQRVSVCANHEDLPAKMGIYRPFSSARTTSKLRAATRMSGCEMEVHGARPFHVYSHASWAPGWTPLYSLLDVDDDT